MDDFADLYTPQGEALLSDAKVPWDVYPRPQMKRDSFFCLNGIWEFAVSQESGEPSSYPLAIRVPFAPETLLSGVHQSVPDGAYLWYRRQVRLTRTPGRRLLLHIDAADQYAAVFVNGYQFCEQLSAYRRTSFDITDALAPEADQFELVIRTHDTLRGGQIPFGKQSLHRGGIWYTPTSGIWGSVWMEEVPQRYIRAVTVQADMLQAVIRAEGVTEGTVVLPDGSEHPLQGGRCALALENPHVWSPEDPYLYYFKLRTPEDEVESYFAVRTISVRKINGKQRFLLNGRPYFFHGLLDQGYFSDGLLTPADPSCYTQEIEKIKALGFNMVRKHIKVEPDFFYAACDRLGLCVFQDMVNNGFFYAPWDAALPVAGFVRRNDRQMNLSPACRRAFRENMDHEVSYLKNFPCIVYWTIFNEGWGQFCSDEMYHELKKLDDTRLIDSASGWFQCGQTDVESRHIYLTDLKYPRTDKPFVLSEFGGYSWNPSGHVYHPSVSFGYQNFQERGEMVAKIRDLYVEKIIPLARQGMCACVYTQVSDVEDETNGLFSFDRKVQKVFPEEMAGIAQALQEAVRM